MLFLPLLCGIFAVATLFIGPPTVNSVVTAFQATLSNPSYDVVRGISRMVHTLLDQVVSVYTAQDVIVTTQKGYVPPRITPSYYQYVPPSRVYDILHPRPLNTPTLDNVWHFNCTAPHHVFGDADSGFGQKAIYARASLTAIALILLGLTVTTFLEWRFAKTRSLEHGAVEESVTVPNGSITIVASPVFEVSHPLVVDAIMTVAFPIGEESEVLDQHDVAVVDLAFAHPIPQGLASPVSEGSPTLGMSPQVELTASAQVAHTVDSPIPGSPILPPVGLPRQLAELANQDISPETAPAARAPSDTATRLSIGLELSGQTVQALDVAMPVATALEDAAGLAIGTSPSVDMTPDATPASAASQPTDVTTDASSPVADAKQSQEQVEDSSMSTSSISKPIGKAAPASEDINGGLTASIHATASVESVSGVSASMWATAPAASSSLASRSGLSASMWATAPTASPSLATGSGLSASMWATAPTAESPSRKSGSGLSTSMWATAPEPSSSRSSSSGLSASIWSTSSPASSSRASTTASTRGSNRYRGSSAAPKGPNPSRKTNVARQSHKPTARPPSSAAPIASGFQPPRSSYGLGASIHAPQATRAAPFEFGSAQQAPASSVVNGLAALASVARNLVPPTLPATVKDSSLDAPRPQDEDEEVFVYPGTTTLDLEGRREDAEFRYPQADETSGESGKQQAPATTTVELVELALSNDNEEDPSLVAQINGNDSLTAEQEPTDTPISAPTCRRTRSLSAPGNCLPHRDHVNGPYDLLRPSSSPPSCARQITLPHRDTEVDRPTQEVQGGVAPSTASDGSVTPIGSSTSATSQPKSKGKPLAPIVPRITSIMDPAQFHSAGLIAKDEDPLQAIVRTIERLEAKAASTEKLPEDYWATERVVATSQSIKEEATRIAEKWEVDAVKTETRRAVKKLQRTKGARKSKAAR